jgi:hypothetical protein
MNTQFHTRSLLDLDPDLGYLLGPGRIAGAHRDLQVPVFEERPGAWNPAIRLAPVAGQVGLLVVSGVLVRQFTLCDSPSAELLGAGDLIRTWTVAGHDQTIEDERWCVLTPLTVARLDASIALRLSQYPEVTALLLDRLDVRIRRLSTARAISQLTGVDLRLQALFDAFAERWGKVTPGGIVVPLPLSHRLLGALVGARRPTVSTALSQLVTRGLLERRADGSWLIPTAETRATGLLTLAA